MFQSFWKSLKADYSGKIAFGGTRCFFKNVKLKEILTSQIDNVYYIRSCKNERSMAEWLGMAMMACET